MTRFAKLIEIENNEQVLLTVNFNNELDNYEVSIRTDFEGCAAEIKLGFDSEEKAQNVLETYSYEQAVKFRNEIIAMTS